MTIDTRTMMHSIHLSMALSHAAYHGALAAAHLREPITERSAELAALHARLAASWALDFRGRQD